MLIKRLRLKKLLSFNDSTVELRQLNVLIGPNAVGKSNLIEAISLLQAAPTSIESQILRGGGVRQWLWLGDQIARIECELNLSRGRRFGPCFTACNSRKTPAGLSSWTNIWQKTVPLQAPRSISSVPAM
jgi:predicted ATPase